MSGIGKIPDRAAHPPGQPPSRPPPGQSHLEISGRFADIAIAAQGRARPPFSLLPPFFFPSPLSGGRSGGGSRPLGAPALPGGSPMSGIGKIPDRAAQPPGQPPSRPPPGQSHLEISGRFADIAIAGQGRAAAVFSPPPFLLPLPPFRGEVGRGVPPLGAPALPGGSPMSGTGKIPDRAAEPPGQPPSRPPPFQGGGEKTQGEERRPRGGVKTNSRVRLPCREEGGDAQAARRRPSRSANSMYRRRARVETGPIA